MVRATLKRTAIGFLLGIAIGILIEILTSYATDGGMHLFSDELISKVGSPATALLLQMLLSGLLGAVAWAGISLYKLEKWSLLAVAATHYAMIMAAYLPIALYLGWIRPAAADIALMAGIMFIAYLIIFLIMYAIYKKEVRQLNTMLKTEENGNSPDK